jgi:hypothetical protein
MVLAMPVSGFSGGSQLTDAMLGGLIKETLRKLKDAVDKQVISSAGAFPGSV